MTSSYKVGSYEAGTDVGDMDTESAHARLLCKTFKIVRLETLGGRISRCCTQSTCACYGGDASYLSTFIIIGKPTVCCRNHTCEAQAVGLHGLHLAFDIKFTILPPYSRTMEIEIHTAKLGYKFIEQMWRSLIGYVYLSISLDVLVRPYYLFKSINTSSGYTNKVSSLGKETSHFESNTRSGTYYYSFFH